MAPLVTQLRRIARRVRRDVEEQNTNIFGYYSDLCGLCAIASAALFKELKREKYNPILCYSNYCGLGHVYVKVGAYIIDITATQFGKGKVVIFMTKRGQKLPWHWTIDATYKSVRALVRRQKIDDWPTSQRADYVPTDS